MKNNMGKCNLIIRPEKGYFNLNNESANGKTYTCNMLRALNSTEKIRTCVLDYDYNMEEKDYIRIIRAKKWDIVMCDNFMLYMTPAIEKEIVDISNEAVVMVDAKSMSRFKVKIPRNVIINRYIGADGSENIEVKEL